MGTLRYRTLRENVVDAIRVKILNQELKPGMRIVEQDLAEEFGISRGPVREALRQMEQEGLIEYARNVGCSVKDVTLEDLYEIYLLKASYEIVAVRLCAGKFSEKALNQMEKALGYMKTLGENEFGRVTEYDNMFHEAIVRQAGLRRLSKAWKDLDYGTMVCCYVSYMNRNEVAGRQYPIHKELLEVCRSGDVDRICKAITDHYSLTIRRSAKERGLSEKEFSFPMDILGKYA